MNGYPRGYVERLVTTAVALLAVAFLLRLAVAVVRPLLPFIGGVTLVVLMLLVAVRMLVRRRDGTW